MFKVHPQPEHGQPAHYGHRFTVWADGAGGFFLVQKDGNRLPFASVGAAIEHATQALGSHPPDPKELMEEAGIKPEERPEGGAAPRPLNAAADDVNHSAPV
jgi:hypothetical protein